MTWDLVEKIVELYNARDGDELDSQMAEQTRRGILRKRHEVFFVEHLLRGNGLDHCYIELKKVELSMPSETVWSLIRPLTRTD